MRKGGIDVRKGDIDVRKGGIDLSHSILLLLEFGKSKDKIWKCR